MPRNISQAGLSKSTESAARAGASAVLTSGILKSVAASAEPQAAVRKEGEEALHQRHHPAQLCRVALERLQVHLQQLGVKLDAVELQKYRLRNVTHGWKLPVTFDGGLKEILYVLLDRDFPFSRPLIGVDSARFLHWPHVESDGILCALPIHPLLIRLLRWRCSIAY